MRLHPASFVLHIPAQNLLLQLPVLLLLLLLRLALPPHICWFGLADCFSALACTVPARLPACVYRGNSALVAAFDIDQRRARLICLPRPQKEAEETASRDPGRGNRTLCLEWNFLPDIESIAVKALVCAADWVSLTPRDLIRLTLVRGIWGFDLQFTESCSLGSSGGGGRENHRRDGATGDTSRCDPGSLPVTSGHPCHDGTVVYLFSSRD